MRFLFCALAIMLSIGLAAAQPKDEPAEPVRVLLLGSYHFANPGKDVANFESEDVLSPRRQEELRVLAEALLTFKPTVVALERTAPPPYTSPGWAGFTAETLNSIRGEHVQIGYRVASAAGIDRVYAVDETPEGDEPDYFPFDTLSAFAAANGRYDELSAIVASAQELLVKLKAAEKKSIPEALIVLNGKDMADQSYWDFLLFGKGEEQPGPELSALYFMRNAKIFNKLAQVTRPGDRVLLIYGVGHRGWLSQMIERAPGFDLEPALPYLKRASAALDKARKR